MKCHPLIEIMRTPGSWQQADKDVRQWLKEKAEEIYKISSITYNADDTGTITFPCVDSILDLTEEKVPFPPLKSICPECGTIMQECAEQTLEDIFFNKVKEYKENPMEMISLKHVAKELAQIAKERIDAN